MPCMTTCLEGLAVQLPQTKMATSEQASAADAGGTSSMTLLDLAPSDHQRILGLLPPSDLCTALQVCKALAAAGDSDLLWRAVAQRRWPAESVLLGDNYKSYRELTFDDNRRNTAWYYPLEPGTACRCIYSKDGYYFKCHLIGLERPRDGTKELRLYYDARGESDLREPGTSMLMLRMRLGATADNTTVIAAIAHDEVVNYVSKPGHFKGWLVWSAMHAESIKTALSIDQDDAGTEMLNKTLVFHYGCNAPDADEVAEGVLNVMVDYTAAKLFSMQQGQDFEMLWRSKAVLTAKGAVGRQLAAEGGEEQRQRWQDLPQGVKARGNGWPGADGLGEWPKEQG